MAEQDHVMMMIIQELQPYAFIYYCGKVGVHRYCRYVGCPAVATTHHYTRTRQGMLVSYGVVLCDVHSDQLQTEIKSNT